MDHNYNNKHKTLNTHYTGSPRRNHQQDSKNKQSYTTIGTTDIDTPPDTTTQETIKANTAQIHTQIVANYMQTIPHNKVLNRIPPEISNTEQALPHYTRRLLAQLPTNKSPILHEYLHKITPKTHPTPNCPLCNSQPPDTQHIFGCPWLPTDLGPEVLWNDPGGAAGLLACWSDHLGWGQERDEGGPCRSPLESTTTTTTTCLASPDPKEPGLLRQ